MFRFGFPGDDTIPRFSALTDNSDYFMRSLYPVIRQEGIQPLNTVRLRDAVYCMEKGIHLLGENSTYLKLSKREDYHDLLDGYQKYNPENSIAHPSFKVYTAAQTNGGIMLFSPTAQGDKSLFGYMQYLTDNFYDKKLDTPFVKLHEIPVFDPELAAKADTFPAYSPSWDGSPYVPPSGDKLIPASALSFGECILEQDMRPTADNYHALVDPKGVWGLSGSARNTDITALVHICSNGYVDTEPLGRYIDLSSYGETFAPVRNDLAMCTEWQRGEVHDYARDLAGLQIAKDFPGIRLIEGLEEYVNECRQSRSFDSDLTVKPKGLRL